MDLEAHQRRIIRGLKDGLQRMVRELDSPAVHVDDERVPQCFVARFGPIGMEAARRNGTVGFFGQAPLIDPGTYMVPNYPTQANPLVGAHGPFYWDEIDMGVDLSWTYTSIPKKLNAIENNTTTLDGALDNSATSVTVVSTAGFPPVGTISVNSEQIDYTSVDATHFLGCTRGANGTTAATHTTGATVSGLNTDLDGAINSSVTTVVTDSTTAFPASGTILIGSEQINYTAKTATDFTGCTRGANGTTAASHADEDPVYSLTPIATGPVNTLPVAGLYDPALAQNGGGIILNNFTGTPQFSGATVRPRVGVEVDIYDKTRGRSITNGRISPEPFTGGSYGFKKIPLTAFPHGSEIEPRLYVTECRMMALLDLVTPTDWSKIQVAAWVNITFKGYSVKAK